MSRFDRALCVVAMVVSALGAFASARYAKHAETEYLAATAVIDALGQNILSSLERLERLEADK